MLLTAVRDALWGFPVVALLLITGGYFTVRTRFFQFHPVRLLKETVFSLLRQKTGRRQLLASVSTALGGTVGVGSIAGVAVGIAVGGPGSVFWMWVSGLTGMALKYAEVFLAVRHGKRLPDGGCSGGTPYALTDAGFPLLGKFFAVCTVFASFGVGNLTQVGALSECTGVFGLSKLPCGLLCSALLACCVFGGQKRIGRINSLLVPAASVLYLLGACLVIASHLSALPGAFRAILSGAFGIRAAAGGISGSLLAVSMREGFARGVFSNEAGVGSSALAHASSGESDPQKQGLWGAFEVLADTFLVSTLTAFALLCAGGTGAAETAKTQFGNAGLLLFTLLTAVFAFSSMLSWCFYADVCLVFLRIPGGRTLYRVLAVLTAFLGCFAPSRLFWCVSDILNAMMIFPNLFLLLRLRKEIVFY